tara:strand:- start:1897 stop:2094 length:198 start_codon:yes stop_codon:yes gene_type:complete
MNTSKQLLQGWEEEGSVESEVIHTKKEMAEVFIENLLFLKDNYSHIDGELGYDLENLIAEYEEYC